MDIYKTEELSFCGARLAYESEITEAEDFSIHREYSWWLADTCDNNILIVDTDGKIVIDKYDAIHAIVPVLLLKNKSKTLFKIGDRFIFGGLQFRIINDNTAICLSSIGNETYLETDKRIPMHIQYLFSNVCSIVNEWFDYFLANKTVKEKDRLPSISLLYDIQKVNTFGKYQDEESKRIVPVDRYVILDRLGNLVQSANGYGYKSWESAQNSLRHWTNIGPIPDSILKAYQDATPLF